MIVWLAVQTVKSQEYNEISKTQTHLRHLIAVSDIEKWDWVFKLDVPVMGFYELLEKLTGPGGGRNTNLGTVLDMMTVKKKYTPFNKIGTPLEADCPQCGLPSMLTDTGPTYIPVYWCTHCKINFKTDAKDPYVKVSFHEIKKTGPVIIAQEGIPEAVCEKDPDYIPF